MRACLFLAVGLGLSLLGVHEVQARHRCPKVPYSEGVLGMTTAPTSLPSGTTMAAARSSETSGCEAGHPSSDFYAPSRARIEHFLEDSLPLVQEEAARGGGPHLQALVQLGGCDSTGEIRLRNSLQVHHGEVFKEPADAVQTTSRLFQMAESDQVLQQSCRWSS
jgi:hypothetical protein